MYNYRAIPVAYLQQIGVNSRCGQCCVVCEECIGTLPLFSLFYLLMPFPFLLRLCRKASLVPRSC